jgi:hypothetical protein
MIVFVSSAMATSASGADPAPGGSGTDTSLPLTDSAQTVRGRDQFAGLEITVNQTRNLTNQAVSITWDNGAPTTSGASRFSANFLQVMQCWGDDDGSVADNPGPPPEQCVQGAVSGTYGGVPGSLYPSGFALTRVISRPDWENFDESVGVLDPRSTNVWRPFRAVDGTVIGAHTDPTFNPAIVGGNFWQNPYFDIVTTNELAAGVTRADGSGAELFQVLTGVQSTGLGCGQRVLEVEGSEPTVPRCWLVIVPRGSPVDENRGTPFETNAEQVGVATSPVAPEAWANRIAVPLEFSPIDSPCRLGADERQVSGNELILSAIASWQPALCGERQLPPFSYASVGDQNARRQIVSPSVGSPGLVVVNQPIPPADVRADSPVVYAPLTASGIAIGFNIERVPKPTSPAAAQELSGVRVADLNLTPRLVAKLLTQSYALSVRIVKPPPYDWVENSPAHLGTDPDFLQFNPEFNLLGNSDRNFASLTVPAGNSDAARQLWEWVLSDPEAQTWLAGEPDEWGMTVNPAYSTSADVNPTGFGFGNPLPLSFPRADSYCYRSGPIGARLDVLPPALCGTDWLPYARSFEEASAMTRAAYDGARISLNPFAFSASNAWSRSEPQYLGTRSFLSVTDTSSAARYGVQMARLSRAGDNSPDRTFVGPGPDGLSAGLQSMKPREVPTVREPAVLEQDADAYPLTTLTYAAIAPLSLDAAARDDYAEFVRYAATEGQTLGYQLGDLPQGYLPLPQTIADEALAAADAIVTLQAQAEPDVDAPPIPGPSPAPTTASIPDPAPVEVAPLTPPAGTGASRPTTRSVGPTSPTPTVTDSDSATEVSVPEPTTTGAPPTTLIPPEAPSAPPTATTPGSGSGPVRFAVPLVSGMALLSALGALELTKRPRRLSDPGRLTTVEPTS